MIIASLDVDAQKGFSKLCPKELVVPGALEIVDVLNVNKMLANFRTASKDVHPENSLWTKKKFISSADVDAPWPRHCVSGTEGAEFLPGLSISDYNFIAYKGMEPTMHPYGACYQDLKEYLSTGLIEYLKSVKVDIVIIGGLATEYCVKVSALQIRKAGFMTIVNLEACRGIAEDTVKEAIKEMMDSGIMVIKDTTKLKRLITALTKYDNFFN